MTEPDNPYKDAEEWGKQDARSLLKKNHPKTTRSLIKIQHILKKHLETKYPLYSQKWKNAYGKGAMDEIGNYQRNLITSQVFGRK